MTSVPKLHTRFTNALSTGELPKAVEYAVRIENAETPPNELARQLRQAITAKEDGLALTILGALKRRYEQIDASESAAVERTNLARRRRVLDDEAVTTLTKHTKAAGEAAGARASVFTTVAVFLHLDEGEKTAARRKQAVSAVDDLITAERTRNEQRTEAKGVVESTTLPPSLTLLQVSAADDTFAVGQEISLEITVGNVGDAEATDIALEITADDGLTIVPTTASVGSLAPDEQSTVSATIDASEAKQYEYKVTATSENAGIDTDRSIVTVTETITTFGAALDANGNGILDTDEIQRAVKLYLNDEPIPHTSEEGGKRLSSEDIRRLIVDWANDRPV